MNLPFLAFSFNDFLGPLMAIGPLKIALICWIALEIAKKKVGEQEKAPAPGMRNKSH